MPKFGRSPFPRRFGGGKHVIEQEHEALLQALAPAFDITDDSPIYAEAYAQACAVAFVWTASGRARGAFIPARMLETLTDWEEACRTRPSSSDSTADRRARVAGKLRGLTGNTLGDIGDALRALLGQRFVDVVVVAPANEVVYWPGVNPGPEGFDWSSNRAVIAARLDVASMSGSEARSLLQRALELLDSMAPAWEGVNAGTGTGVWIVNQGVVGQTLL